MLKLNNTVRETTLSNSAIVNVAYVNCIHELKCYTIFTFTVHNLSPLLQSNVDWKVWKELIFTKLTLQAKTYTTDITEGYYMPSQYARMCKGTYIMNTHHVKQVSLETFKSFESTSLPNLSGIVQLTNHEVTPQ